ncbi:MAG: hypothetical protein ACTHMC_02690 [Pseudobacter sp.]|uniref:hypothetical protein n=1 Tax=Pseudobacter sp. TaxID=2045420 RepID=UPI003F809BE9
MNQLITIHMKEEILANQHDPAALETLYRSDKPAFKRSFNLLYPGLQNNSLLGFWQARLNYTGTAAAPDLRHDLLFVIIASVMAALVAKLPVIFGLNEEPFYMRNVGFIVFPFLTAYFAWKHKAGTGKILFVTIAMLASVVYINSLPDVMEHDTTQLACIHLPLFLWSLLGFVFGDTNNQPGKRLNFLSYNGDLLVMTTLILIAGGILTAVTINLFSMIGIQIEKIYFNYVVITGLSAAPLLGTYLVQSNPQLVGKVSPVIARIFSPLVLVMLVVFLVAFVSRSKDPFNDREFLLLFNVLLIGVMAIIFFSIAEASRHEKTAAEIWILLLLSVVTIIVNGIVLAAILFRISSWGLTPNRLAVLGGNVLILINILLVTRQLYLVASKKKEAGDVGISIAAYLPVYAAWAIIVTFLFPIIFGFR